MEWLPIALSAGASWKVGLRCSCVSYDAPRHGYKASVMPDGAMLCLSCVGVVRTALHIDPETFSSIPPASF